MDWSGDSVYADEHFCICFAAARVSNVCLAALSPWVVLYH